MSSSTTPVDKSGQRVRQMFAEIAPRYDFLNHFLSMNIDKRWRNWTVSQLKLDRDLPILDACTGTGDLAIALAVATKGKVPVIGSDFCPEMLARADVKKGKMPSPEWPVEFIEADTQRLPFADNLFQAVTVAFGLRNVSDTDAGLREMTRVCAPGGQVAVLEFSKPTLPGLRQIYLSYFKYILPRVGQMMAKNREGAYEYLPQSVQEFPCGNDLAERMRQAGLRDVTFHPLTFGIATLYLGVK